MVERGKAGKNKQYRQKSRFRTNDHVNIDYFLNNWNKLPEIFERGYFAVHSIILKVGLTAYTDTKILKKITSVAS